MIRLGLALLVATLALTSCVTPQEKAHQHLVAAKTALEAGKLEEARMHAETVREAMPDEPDAKKVLAGVYRALARQAEEEGALEKAHGNYLRAAELEPYREKKAQDWFDAWRNGRDAGLETAELSTHLVQSLDANPSNLEVRRAAATTFDELNQPNDAITHYLWLWEADRSDVPVGLRLGALYLVLKEFGDAEAIFRRILEADPTNVQAKLQLADVYEGMGRSSRARAIYRDLEEEFPENAMILFRYADFLDRTGDAEYAERVRARARGELPGVKRREMRELKSRKKKR